MKALKQQHTSKEKQYDFPSLNIFSSTIKKKIPTPAVSAAALLLS